MSPAAALGSGSAGSAVLIREQHHREEEVEEDIPSERRSTMKQGSSDTEVRWSWPSDCHPAQQCCRANREDSDQKGSRPDRSALAMRPRPATAGTAKTRLRRRSAPKPLSPAFTGSTASTVGSASSAAPNPPFSISAEYAAEGGLPLYTGELWLGPDEGRDFSLGTAERCVALLLTSGMHLVLRDSGSVRSFPWSAFAFVSRYCGPSQQSWEKAGYYTFLMTSSRGEVTRRLFLGTRGQDAEFMREQWLSEIASALRTHIRSRLPVFDLTAWPIHEVVETQNRLLAGHLLVRLWSCLEETLKYCEIQLSEDHAGASLVMYDDHSCVYSSSLQVMLTADTRLFERDGEDCSCFSLDGHNFCARSKTEAQLWLRVLVNLRVKLKNSCEMSAGDLPHFRKAITERIVEVAGSEEPTYPACIWSPAPPGKKEPDQVKQRDRKDTGGEDAGRNGCEEAESFSL